MLSSVVLWCSAKKPYDSKFPPASSDVLRPLPSVPLCFLAIWHAISCYILCSNWIHFRLKDAVLGSWFLKTYLILHHQLTRRLSVSLKWIFHRPHSFSDLGRKFDDLSEDFRWERMDALDIGWPSVCPKWSQNVFYKISWVMRVESLYLSKSSVKLMSRKSCVGFPRQSAL